MRNLLCVAVLLLSAAWVAAQSSSSSPSSSSSSSQSASSSSQTTPSSSQTPSSSASSNAGETKVEGCLNSSNGSYTLTARDGTTYQLSGDTSRLADHVGHEVQITGTTSSSSASSTSPGSSSSTSPASSGGTSSSSQPMLNVASMKHISKTCSASSSSR